MITALRWLRPSFCVAVVLFFSCLSPTAVKAAEQQGSWVSYDAQGRPAMIADDAGKKDGKPHHWRYYRDGKVYRREWDRNFDGKPDLKIMEQNGVLTQKSYDDNFDGVFEKTEKFPQKS